MSLDFDQKAGQLRPPGRGGGGGPRARPAPDRARARGVRRPSAPHHGGRLPGRRAAGGPALRRRGHRPEPFPPCAGGLIRRGLHLGRRCADQGLCARGCRPAHPWQRSGPARGAGPGAHRPRAEEPAALQPALRPADHQQGDQLEHHRRLRFRPGRRGSSRIWCPTAAMGGALGEIFRICRADRPDPVRRLARTHRRPQAPAGLPGGQALPCAALPGARHRPGTGAARGPSLDGRPQPRSAGPRPSWPTCPRKRCSRCRIATRRKAPWRPACPWPTPALSSRASGCASRVGKWWRPRPPWARRP